MGKDSVLGHDPLGWMKATKENKKSFPAVGGDETIQNTEKSDQQTGSQSLLSQQAPASINQTSDKNFDVSKPPQTPGKTDSAKTDSITHNAAPKPRVAIGRLYEKLSPERAKAVQRSEGTSHDLTKNYGESSFSASRTIQPIKRIDPERNHALRPVASDRISTYIIIAYTALLLILGYFVYSDLSKRTSRIEARIFAIEKALHLK